MRIFGFRKKTSIKLCGNKTINKTQELPQWGGSNTAFLRAIKSEQVRIAWINFYDFFLSRLRHPLALVEDNDTEKEEKQKKNTRNMKRKFPTDSESLEFGSLLLRFALSDRTKNGRVGVECRKAINIKFNVGQWKENFQGRRRYVTINCLHKLTSTALSELICKRWVCVEWNMIKLFVYSDWLAFLYLCKSVNRLLARLSCNFACASCGWTLWIMKNRW